MTTKPERGFKEATLSLIMREALPIANRLTGGKVEYVGDSVGDRARAMRIALTEAAELFTAIESAAEAVEAGNATYAQIETVIAQANDVPEAIKLLRDPGAVVNIDGTPTTADDDVNPRPGTPDRPRDDTPRDDLPGSG